MMTKASLFLTLFTGMALVWLLTLAAAYDWRRLSPYYQPKQQDKLFIVVTAWRWLALIVASLAVLVPFMFVSRWSIEQVAGSSYLVTGFVGVMTGGLFSFLAHQLWLMRCYFNEQGVWGINILGFPHYIAWSEVQKLTFSYALQSYKLQGTGWPVYLSQQLDEQDELAYNLWRYLPPDVIQTPLSYSPPRKAEEDALILLDDPSHGYLKAQRFCRHAGKTVIVASIPFLASLFSVLPDIRSTLLAGLLGVFFMLPAYALLLWPRISHPALNKLDFVGFIVGATLFQIAVRLHLNLLGGEEHLTMLQVFASVTQTISLGVLIPAAGIVVILRR